MSDPQHRRFERVAAEIRTAIREGGLMADALLPSERQLQETYGVSRTTVRRALAELVATGWAENSPNRGMVSRLGRTPSRSTRIAYIDHRDDVHRSLFFKLHTRAAEAGFDLVHVDSREVGTMGGLRRAAHEGFAGAFVWPKVALVDPDDLARIQSLLPVISVDHSIGGQPCDMVMSDHAQGARLVVDHLLGLGRRRIAISGNFTTAEDAQLRFNGYMNRLYEHNVVPSASDFVFSSPQSLPYEDPRLLAYRLAEPDRPDAVFVLHDMSVPAIVESILAAGLSVPGDVAVVGFGNDLPFNVEDAGLTSVAMNWDGVADALIGRLRERLANPNAPFRRVLVPTALVVRGSCGAPRKEWSDLPHEVSSVTVTRRMAPHIVSPTPAAVESS